MAGKGHPRNVAWKWTKETEDRLNGLWGTMSTAAVARFLSRETGHTFTRAAVVQQATRKLGLNVSDAQGEICISHAAESLGIGITALHGMIKRRGLAVKGHGYCRFLTDATWQALQEMYAQPPEPTITPKQAVIRLKQSIDWIYASLKANEIKAWRYGGQWRISAADVERLYWEQAKVRK